jgi:hypothetical protein
MLSSLASELIGWPTESPVMDFAFLAGVRAGRSCGFSELGRVMQNGTACDQGHRICNGKDVGCSA